MAQPSKLSEEQKEEIRQLRAEAEQNNTSLPYAALAAQYNVSKATIIRICHPEKYERHKEANRKYHAENHKSVQENEKSFSEAELLYRFTVLYGAVSKKNKDYGYGPPVTMAEVHTATIIDDHPGISVSQIATHYGRTNSAMSQLVTKLENKGLVVRIVADNLRNIHLYTTPTGSKLCSAHKLYDSKITQKTKEALLSCCTKEDMDIFFKVLQEYVHWIEQNLLQDKPLVIE